jgi:outer membrane receptor protein involved in Fe transport
MMQTQGRMVGFMNLRAAAVKILTVLAIVGFATTATGQTRGGIRGVVVDASGARVAGAVIAARETATGMTRETSSDPSGTFTLAALPPGHYVVEVRAAGHKTWRRDLRVAVNEEQRADVRLDVGDVSEIVQVTAATRGLLDAGPLSTIVPFEAVQHLPLDGRNFLELSLLAAGTAPAAQGSASSVRGDFSFTANGAREDFNSYLLDGADNVDPKLNTVAVRPAVEAIREFKVSTNAYDAAFGRYAGAQVNVVTRAGSNAVSGSGYGYMRNRALDSTNAFALRSEPAPRYERYQAGGAVGGPIARDKAFFFVDYEGSRRREGITRVTTVPTAAERSGDFTRSLAVPVNPVTGQPMPFLPSFAQHPTGSAVANLYPVPNRAGTAANFVSSPIERDDAHHFDVRVDRAHARGGELTARYSFNERDLFEPFSGAAQTFVPGYGNDVPRRAQSAMVSDARVLTPAWLNEARVSFTRVASAVSQEGQGTSVNRQVGIPDLSSDARDWGLSYISLLGYSALGHEINNPQESNTNAWHVSDTLSWSRGAHLVKLGGEVRLIGQDAFRDVLSRGQLLFTGQITGNPVADLLLGAPVFTVGATLDNPQHLRARSWSAFAQDSWRVAEDITVNAGVRYELFTPAVDRDDRANLYDPTTGQLVPVGTNGIPRGGYDSDRNNIAPRVGVTWAPGSGTTLLRGGYGMYYSQSALAPSEALYFSPPYFNARFYFPLPGLPLSISDPFPSSFPVPSPPSALSIQRDLATPLLHHWNLGVEHQLGRFWRVTAAYAGSRGEQLLASRDINQPAPSANPLNLRPNPQFTDITTLESRARSRYHALVTSVERRFSDGMSLLASYTWSSSKDDASGFFSSAGDPNFPQDSRHPEAEYGRSNFDVRHRMSLGFVYELPFARDGSVWLREWQLAGILTLQSGRPFTVAVLPDIDISNTGRASLGFGFNDRPNVVGDPEITDASADRWFNTAAFAMPAFGSFGNAGRNILEGPGYANVNLGVIKHVPLGGRAKLQLRAEAFNLLNRVNYDLPDAFVGSPTFGRILSAGPPRRCQFGARVLF